jgi:MFS family permease
VMTKGFPIVVAPVALAWLVARGERAAALEAGAALVAVVLAVGAAALALSPTGALDAVRYQTDRPVQVESAPAGVLLALDGLGLGHARSVKDHRSDGLSHPASELLSASFGALLLGTLGLFAAAAVRSGDGGPPDERRLVLASLAAVTAFAALGRVLSPQFLIWIIPLMGLAFAWRQYALGAAAAGAIALTLVEFPSRYFELVARQPFPVVVVALRNAALLALLGLAGRALAGPRLRAPAAAPARWPWRVLRPPPPRSPRSATDPRRRSRT